MLRILVADDNDVMRDALERILSELGEVTAVDSGPAAISACLETDFDVILMDIRMPDMDGVSACKALREAGCTAPVIAITADDSVEYDSAYAAAGFSGLVAKPFRAAELLTIVRDVLAAEADKT